jgi:DNA-binding beta-propeller fold protein YncE
VLKFSRDGKFLLQIGKPGQLGDSNSTTSLNRPTGIDVAGGEVYVADGNVNRRVVVFDAKTGAYKRHWGAYGVKPDDAPLEAYDPAAPPARQFRSPSCVAVARDGLVYVCDRQNDRIQVFKADGTFVKEAFLAKTTRGNGSVWDVAFSHDPQQRLLYVADGQNQRVVVLQRDSLAEAGSFGGGGRAPGMFYAVGSLAVDAAGNLYTGETFEGKRVQKFVRK